MNKITIITDNTSDLTNEIYKQNDVVILKIKAFVGDKEVTDLSEEEMFKLADKEGTLPKTAATNVAEFEEIFGKYAKDSDVLYIGLGSGFSSTYGSAVIASESFDNVYTIDSKNLSSGIGLLVLKMCKYRDQGLSAPEIKEKIDALVPKVRTSFAINTLQYLHKGGRCSSLSSILGTMLNLKPIIKVSENKLIVAKKPIGFGKALRYMIDDIVEKANDIDLDAIMITHCLADEDAQYIREKLEKKFDKNIIFESNASVVISSHCGPRTIGILYIMK